MITKWVALDDTNQKISQTWGEGKTITQNSIPQKIVEAQGWVVSQGNVYLVAQVPTSISQNHLLQPNSSCNVMDAVYK